MMVLRFSPFSSVGFRAMVCGVLGVAGFLEHAWVGGIFFSSLSLFAKANYGLMDEWMSG